MHISEVLGAGGAGAGTAGACASPNGGAHAPSSAAAAGEPSSKRHKSDPGGAGGHGAAAAAAQPAAPGSSAGGDDPCHCVAGLLQPSPPKHSSEELAAMFTAISAKYMGGLDALQLPPAARQLLQTLWTATERLGGGWLSHARRLLRELSGHGAGGSGSTAVAAAAQAQCGAQQRQPQQQQPRMRHVLVTSGQLVATYGKLLLFGLDGLFGLGAVYSASGATKLHCFKRIAAAAAPGALLCAVGDGAEEEQAAGQLGWPFVRITLAPQPPPTSSPQRGDATAGMHMHRRPRVAADALGSLGQPLTAITAEQLLSSLCA